jgi:hypothetical protein
MLHACHCLSILSVRTTNTSCTIRQTWSHKAVQLLPQAWQILCKGAMLRQSKYLRVLQVRTGALQLVHCVPLSDLLWRAMRLSCISCDAGDREPGTLDAALMRRRM